MTVFIYVAGEPILLVATRKKDSITAEHYGVLKSNTKYYRYHETYVEVLFLSIQPKHELTTKAACAPRSRTCVGEERKIARQAATQRQQLRSCAAGTRTEKWNRHQAQPRPLQSTSCPSTAGRTATEGQAAAERSSSARTTMPSRHPSSGQQQRYWPIRPLPTTKRNTSGRSRAYEQLTVSCSCL
jgi:hypothetical protein